MKEKELSGRVFTASIWHDKNNKEINLSEINEIFKENEGICDIYAIYHDRDKTKHAHWHIVIMYKTPRRISTPANILNVDKCIIQKVQNTRKIMRYLIHADDKDKEQYTPEEVLSNSNKNYLQWIVGKDMTDKQILNDMKRYGTAQTIENLLGIVETNKLIQVARLREIMKKS